LLSRAWREFDMRASSNLDLSDDRVVIASLRFHDPDLGG
jgi:hypothetical protein